MDTTPTSRYLAAHTERDAFDAPGIVIADGGIGARIGRRAPIVRAFIYGEHAPTSPALPFGRWKEAS